MDNEGFAVGRKVAFFKETIFERILLRMGSGCGGQQGE